MIGVDQKDRRRVGALIEFEIGESAVVEYLHRYLLAAARKRVIEIPIGRLRAFRVRRTVRELRLIVEDIDLRAFVFRVMKLYRPSEFARVMVIGAVRTERKDVDTW